MTKNFDLDARLAPVYSAYPEASHRPLIGLTANFADGNAMLRNHYYEQVVAAGGVPVIIPPVTDKDVIIKIYKIKGTQRVPFIESKIQLYS